MRNSSSVTTNIINNAGHHLYVDNSQDFNDLVSRLVLDSVASQSLGVDGINLKVGRMEKSGL